MLRASLKRRNATAGCRARFVGQPELVFLDEPSTGLDVGSRKELHETIRQARLGGRTLVLTTHYLEEAAALCDRVGIIDHGKLAAVGTVSELRARISPLASIHIRWTGPSPQTFFTGSEANNNGSMDADRKGVHMLTPETGRTVTAIVRRCDELGLELTDIEITRASLEDIFIKAVVNDATEWA